MEMIISTMGKYDYTDGMTKKTNIGKREADKILTRWIREGKTIRHKYLMGGKVVQCYHD